MPRVFFQERLNLLQEDLIRMGDRVEKSIAQAVEALLSQNVELAHDVIEGDLQINQMQRSLTEQSLVLIATQQPMASDLRTIFAVSNIASDLERMGDHAEGIAKLALRIANEPVIAQAGDIPQMAELARLMLREQLTAFHQRNATQARQACQRDAEMDKLYDLLYHKLVYLMAHDPATITRANYLLWVAHNLERIADRTTNIGEQVVFLVTGGIEELNPKRIDPATQSN